MSNHNGGPKLPSPEAEAIALKRTRLAAQRQVARIERVLAQQEPPAV